MRELRMENGRVTDADGVVECAHCGIEIDGPRVFVDTAGAYCSQECYALGDG